MADVLWISGVGGAILFIALGGIVLFMYLLTWQRIFPADKNDEEAEAAAEVEEPADVEIEHERRRRAIALAVATACAGEAQMLAMPADSSGEWRHLGRARQLASRAPRRRA